jgi:hypothetical protein
LRWFQSLRTAFPFVRNWRGLRWLDQQLSAHADLVRYALQESGDYVLERIAEARAERDTMLGGIPHLMERIGALNVRAQEISPGYAVSASVDADGRSTVRLAPRRSVSAELSAITITSEFRFRTGDPAEEKRRVQFEEAMRFGGEVDLYAQNLGVTTIDAPYQLGLSGSFVPDRMRITSPREDIDPPMRAQLAVERSSGLPAASLPVRFTVQEAGTDGVTLHGGDQAGFLHLRMRVDQRNRSCQMKLSFTPPQHALPDASIPVLRLIQHALPGRVLALALAGASSGSVRAIIREGMTPVGWTCGEAQEWADAYQDLARLQSRVGQYFPVPEDFSRRDAREVRRVLTLLDGQQVQLPGDTASIDVASVEGLELVVAAMAGGETRFASQTESLVFSIGGHDIDLGPCIEIATVDKLLNVAEARRALAEHGSATVHMRIKKDAPVIRYLGTALP